MPEQRSNGSTAVIQAVRSMHPVMRWTFFFIGVLCVLTVLAIEFVGEVVRSTPHQHELSTLVFYGALIGVGILGIVPSAGVWFINKIVGAFSIFRKGK